MFQSRKDYKKCLKVIQSCDTLYQINTSMNMTHMYGRMYNFNHYWSKLSKISFKKWEDYMDLLDYRKRLKDVMEEGENEQEISVNAQGTGNGIEYHI